MTRFAIALHTPNRYCLTQGTSPNFTTAPVPCQIRQALFFFVSCSAFDFAQTSLLSSPPQLTPKTEPANLSQLPGTQSLTLSRPVPQVKSSTSSRISTPSSSQTCAHNLSHTPKPMTATSLQLFAITNVLPPKILTNLERINIISPFSWPVKFKIGQNETSCDESTAKKSKTRFSKPAHT
jgi:hypothetical protein